MSPGLRTQGRGSIRSRGRTQRSSLRTSCGGCCHCLSGGRAGSPPQEQGEGPAPKAEGRHPFIPGSDAPAESPGLGLTGQEPSSHSGHSREGPTKALAPPGDPWEAWGLNGDASWRAPGAMPTCPAALSPTGKADADSARAHSRARGATCPGLALRAFETRRDEVALSHPWDQGLALSHAALHSGWSFPAWPSVRFSARLHFLPPPPPAESLTSWGRQHAQK